MDHAGDRNEETSSHALLTEPVRIEQLHTAFDNGDQTTCSSTKQSTHIEYNESEVEKGISNGEDMDNSAAAENIERKKKETQNTVVMPNGKEKDLNLVGWEGLVALSPNVQIKQTEHSLQVLMTLKILRIGPRARNTSSPSSTPS
jgi:hypothetical protein